MATTETAAKKLTSSSGTDTGTGEAATTATTTTEIVRITKGADLKSTAITLNSRLTNNDVKLGMLIRAAVCPSKSLTEKGKYVFNGNTYPDIATAREAAVVGIRSLIDQCVELGAALVDADPSANIDITLGGNVVENMQGAELFDCVSGFSAEKLKAVRKALSPKSAK